MISKNKVLILRNTKVSLKKGDPEGGEIEQNIAPYPYAGIIRIRFKGSVLLGDYSRTSQAIWPPLRHSYWECIYIITLCRLKYPIAESITRNRKSHWIKYH